MWPTHRPRRPGESGGGVGGFGNPSARLPRPRISELKTVSGRSAWRCSLVCFGKTAWRWPAGGDACLL